MATQPNPEIDAIVQRFQDGMDAWRGTVEAFADALKLAGYLPADYVVKFDNDRDEDTTSA
jgi:hypothetical protein